MAARIDGSAFSSLQKALKQGSALVFFAFDLLRIDGEDLRKIPQIDRRERLARLLSGIPADGPLRLSEHIVGSGTEVYANACKVGAEGIISKRIDAPYRSMRSKAWRKVKCTRRQEFVIVGYSPSNKTGRPFASLLLATRQDGSLLYKGKVGTGFSDATLAELSQTMRSRKTAPCEGVPSDVAQGAKWVRADLVAEVGSLFLGKLGIPVEKVDRKSTRLNSSHN